MEKEFDNQRLMVRFRADSMENEREDRYLTGVDKSLLIDDEVGRNSCTRASGRC